MTMAEHDLTLPWCTDAPYPDVILDSDGEEVASFSSDDDCVFAVKAVNNHERLVKALEAVVHDVNEYERINRLAPTPGHVECWDSIAHAKAVLTDLIRLGHT